MSDSTVQMTDIPAVDLRDFDEGNEARKRLVETVGQGFHDIGFIYVRAPEIKAKLPRIYDVFRKVFDVPYGLKVRYRRKEIGHQVGYTPYYEEIALACKRAGIDEPRLPDAKEGWFMGRPVSADDPRVEKYPLAFCPNIWPEEVPELQPAMKELYYDCFDLGKQVLRILGEYLGLESGFFQDMVRDGPTRLRGLHYPPISDMEVGKIVWGCEHTDINLITVLPGGTSLPEGVDAGLRVQRRDGVWIPGSGAPEGYVIVQVGDMLQELTKHHFLSASHKVVAPDRAIETGRLSAACFIHPRSEFPMIPFDEDGDPEDYPTSYDDLEARLQEISLAD